MDFAITEVEYVDEVTIEVTGIIACPEVWNPYVELELTQRNGRVYGYGEWGDRTCTPEGETFTIYVRDASVVEDAKAVFRRGAVTFSVNAYGWQFAEEGGLDFLDIANYTTRVTVR